LRNKECIENITCFTEEKVTLNSALRLAKGKEQAISHKFCFAVNSGKCSSSKFISRKASWHQDDFCPAWKIQFEKHLNQGV
jgi:hypothetical protein